MTPEETLDWLAQQHFDQCREARPIQDWIRKMKSQLPKQEQGEPVDEQAAFEEWLYRVCPSGDVEDVQRQWEASSDYADLYTKPQPKHDEPVGYVQTVIEALYENSDPVSVDAAELLERISIKEGQIEDLTYKADYWKRMQDEVRAQWIKDTSIKQEQGEPVAWIWDGMHGRCVSLEPWLPNTLGIKAAPLYTTPQQRTWVGLTDEEREQVYKIWRFHPSNETNLHLCKAIEAKLKEKNG
jgi:hypothetical protein